MAMISNDWTGLGYILGISIVLAINIDKSHWITVVSITILSILMRKHSHKLEKANMEEKE